MSESGHGKDKPEVTSASGTVKNRRHQGQFLTLRLVGPEAPFLFGLSPDERIARMFEASGGSGSEGSGVLILRRDSLCSASVLAWLVEKTGRAVENGLARAIHVSPEQAESAEAWALGTAPPPDHVQVIAPERAGGDYSKKLRKRETPWCIKVDRDTAQAAEWRLYGASYKGVTDLITKYLWPRPAFHVTRLAARLGFSPNMVTSLSALLVIAAFWLFQEGAFLAGLAAAFGMTFLDTVDGKLARVTVRSSALGNAFDHGIDLIHPPFWYWAWAEGLRASGAAAHLDLQLWLIVAGYVAGRLFEGWFIARHGIEMHVWRRFDSRFRLIVARRNPNLALLLAFTLVGRPDLGFMAVAAWTLVSLVVHPLQIMAAERARAHGGPLTSWLDGQGRDGR